MYALWEGLILKLVAIMLYLLQKKIDSDLRPLFATQSDKERYLVKLQELYSR